MKEQMKLKTSDNIKFDEQLKNLADKFDIRNSSNLPKLDLFGRVCSKWAKKEGISPSVLSLFTGGGGLDIAFHDAGFDVKEMIEINEKFCKTLRHHCSSSGYFNKNCKVKNVDIRDYQPNDIGDIDVMIGGPPCQAFSAAGRRAAGVEGINSEEGKLFKEYVRLLEKHQPTAFLFENVYGLPGAGSDAWKKIKRDFESVGYKLYYRELDTADYGVPQHRARLFAIGVREDTNTHYRFPRPTHGPDSVTKQNHYSAKEAIEGVEKETTSEDKIGGKYGGLLADIPPGLNYSFYTKKMGHPNPRFAWRSKFSDFLYKADPDRPVRTIKAQGGLYTGPFHWENRHFTIDELKRLQTIPDEYKLIGTKTTKEKLIGNSVPPNAGRILALSILDQVFSYEIPLKLEYMSKNDELGFKARRRKKTKYYRKKARESIDKMKKEGKLNYPSQADHYFKKTESFEISEASSDEFDFKVESTIKKEQDNEELTLTAKFNDSPDQSITIVLKPIKEWELPVRNITLISSSTDPLDITYLWKSCKWIIQEYFKMDDLVQVYGYYKREPKFKIHMEDLESSDEKLRILKEVYKGKVCGTIISEEKLAKNLSISHERTLDTAIMLKDLGYEIRNHNTNPTIPEGNYLIPYPFPTLDKNSVQLHKSLTLNEN